MSKDTNETESTPTGGEPKTTARTVFIPAPIRKLTLFSEQQYLNGKPVLHRHIVDYHDSGDWREGITPVYAYSLKPLRSPAGKYLALESIIDFVADEKGMVTTINGIEWPCHTYTDHEDARNEVEFRDCYIPAAVLSLAIAGDESARDELHALCQSRGAGLTAPEANYPKDLEPREWREQNMRHSLAELSEKIRSGERLTLAEASENEELKFYFLKREIEAKELSEMEG